jgi:hypothetical protein
MLNARLGSIYMILKFSNHFIEDRSIYIAMRLGRVYPPLSSKNWPAVAMSSVASLPTHSVVTSFRLCSSSEIMGPQVCDWKLATLPLKRIKIKTYQITRPPLFIIASQRQNDLRNAFRRIGRQPLCFPLVHKAVRKSSWRDKRSYSIDSNTIFFCSQL